MMGDPYDTGMLNPLYANEAEYSKHLKISNEAQALCYGMKTDEFEKRVAALIPDGDPAAMSEWISGADSLEEELGFSKEKSLLEYYVEFSLIKQHFGDETALRLFNLALKRCPLVIELRGIARLLHEGTAASEAYERVAEDGLTMTIKEDIEFGKAIISFVRQNGMSDHQE